MPRPNEDENEKPTSGESDVVSQTDVSDEPVTIRVDEPEEDDDGAEPQQLTEEQKASRRERRQQRKSQFEEARARAEQAERDAAQARADAAAARAQAEQVSNWYRQQQQPQQDPFTAHENGLQQRFAELTEQAALLSETGKMTPEKLGELRNKTYQVMQQQAQLAAQKQLYYNNLQAQQYQQQNAGQQDSQAVMQRLRMDFPDVVNHQEAWQYAVGQYQTLLATRKVKQNPWDTIQDVMADTRRVFGMARSPAPSEATKRRFSGVGGGANGAVHSSGAKTVVMGVNEKRMAKAMYPDLYKSNPQKAFQKWAKECGQEKGDED